MFAGLRFLWNASRGYRNQPWRSPYLRWRIETFSGMHADNINNIDFWRFAWRERARLWHFLRWCNQMDRLTGRWL